MSVGFEESLLQNVFCIIIILSDLLGHPENPAVIVADQLRKGFYISGFGAHHERRFIKTSRYRGSTHAMGIFSLTVWSCSSRYGPLF
jgi:hypothetical protein